jgi:radical SAM protein with 4Fe4S-binding SPASM domain
MGITKILRKNHYLISIKRYLDNKSMVKWVNTSTRKLLSQYRESNTLPDFGIVDIETYNRCNNVCPFCPANRKDDIREEKKMSVKLFKKICTELGEMNYKGRLTLCSNNEPFLDERIETFAKMARDTVPDCDLRIVTNGILLTLDRYKAVMEYLDLLVIDNYSDQMKMITPVRRISDYISDKEELKRKTIIFMRKLNEEVTNRGSISPNATNKKIVSASCMNPWVAMVVRPDGKVSLCCADVYGKHTLGDTSCQTLMQIWRGDQYNDIRYKHVTDGRGSIDSCRYCDYFIVRDDLNNPTLHP